MRIHLPQQFLHGPGSGGDFNLSSFGVILFLTLLLILGMKSSARVNHLMVFIKLSVIALFIGIAVMNVHVENWTPFMPFGWSGVVDGASLIFFAYIGFDAVSTTAEEAINPQRNLPIGIIGSLLICTLLYIIVSGLLTAIVPYAKLNVSSPISHVLLLLGYRLAAGLVGIGAIAGLTTVMLVLFYGLTRVFFAMARDGLLPQFFAKASPKTKVPARIILTTGIIMALIAALTPIGDLAELVNIGTLFAFIVVSVGVIVLRYSQPHLKRPFKTPFMPYIPILGILNCSYLIAHLPWVTLLRFVIWMMIGIVVYFSYGRFYSHMRLIEPR